MTVSREQRFRKGFTCPVCGGHKDLAPGKGERCWGFDSGDGWLHCAREEHAGQAPFNAPSATYAHRREGCGCGVPHVDGSGGGPPPSRRLAAVGARRIVTTYDYTDERGERLYQKVRYVPKDFRLRRPHPTEAGEWLYKLDDPDHGIRTRRVPYRLPQLLAADPDRPVDVPEGEKDVESLVALGLVATCECEGAPEPGQTMKWRPEYTAALRGRHVRFYPDNDDQGRYRVQQIAPVVATVAASVTIVEIPAAYKDVSDYLAAGHTREDLERLPRRGLTSAQAAGPVSIAQAGRDFLAAMDQGPPVCFPMPFPTLNRMMAGGIRPGELLLVGGDTGEGKTSLGVEVARHGASRGVGTLVLSREMTIHSLTGRWFAQAAEVPYEHLRTYQVTPNERQALASTLERAPGRTLWLDARVASIEALEGLLDAWPFETPVQLLVVDYLQRLTYPKGIRDRSQAYELNCSALKTLAHTRTMAVVCLSSLNRPERKGPATPDRHRFRGSGQLEYDCDIGLMLYSPTREDTREVQVHVVKNRDGRQGMTTLRFRGEVQRFEEPAERAPWLVGSPAGRDPGEDG